MLQEGWGLLRKQIFASNSGCDCGDTCPRSTCTLCIPHEDSFEVRRRFFLGPALDRSSLISKAWFAYCEAGCDDMRWVRWHRPTREGGNRLGGTRCAPCSDCMRGAQVWVCSPVQNPLWILVSEHLSSSDLHRKNVFYCAS